MEGMQTENKDIAPKYLALVERYKAEPFKSIKRVKMMTNFVWWYRKNKDKLTEDEKEYLQANITEVNCDIPKYTYWL